jgi:hypothetical protein
MSNNLSISKILSHKCGTDATKIGIILLQRYGK